MTNYYLFSSCRLIHFFAALCIISVSGLLSSCGGGGGGGSDQVRPTTLNQLQINVPRGGPTLVFSADSTQATAGVETGGVSYQNAAEGPNETVINVTGAADLNVIQTTWPLDVATLRYTYTPTGSSSGRIEFTGVDGETATVPAGNFTGVGSIFSEADTVPTQFAIIFNSNGSQITNLNVTITFDADDGGGNTESYTTTIPLGFVRARDGLPVSVGFEGEEAALSSLLTDGEFDGGTVALEELAGGGVINTQTFGFTADATPTATSSDNENPITETGQVVVTRTLDRDSVVTTVATEIFQASYVINQPFGTDEARVNLTYQPAPGVLPQPTNGVLVLDFADLTSGVFTDTDGTTTGTFNFLP